MLAPMLFAITMEPLLSFLKEQWNASRMMGIQILQILHLYECMFVDDMGILITTTQQCFSEVEESISLYGKAFEEKLNILKSKVNPIGFTTIPQWFADKGYTIIQQGKIT